MKKSKLENEKEGKFEITLINDDETNLSSKEALPCKECGIDYVSCSGQQDDFCMIDFA